MSDTFYLLCPESKEYIWIGQGWDKMTTLYSGEDDVMTNLKNFLNTNTGKALYFENSNFSSGRKNFREYKKYE